MTDDTPLTYGSLFAGIGGLDLGAEAAGFACRWQVEWDDWCQQRLAQRWPDVDRHSDVSQVDPAQLAPVDLIIGGFPCQPISVAGRQRAQDDDRWLWPDFARLVRALQPSYVLVENVRNLLRVNDGSAMAEVLRDLALAGYDARWDVLGADDVGAPHQRDRLWVRAWRDGLEMPRTQPLARLDGDVWCAQGDSLWSGSVPMHDPWPTSGTMHAGSAYVTGQQLHGGGGPTYRTWPTPQAGDTSVRGPGTVHEQRAAGATVQHLLSRAVAGLAAAEVPATPGGPSDDPLPTPDGLAGPRVRQWPTPNAGMDHHSDSDAYWDNRIAKGRQEDLYMAVTKDARSRKWPTPRANEDRGTGPFGSKSHQYRLDRDYLDATVQDAEQASGALNPTWLEWLMGLPLGWTNPDVDDPQPHPGWQVDPADVGDLSRLGPRGPSWRNRLHAIGNAVVPQVGYVAVADLLAMHNRRG